MSKPSFKDILKRKINRYGKTEAAYEFAADEYAKELINFNAHDDDCCINAMECNCSKSKDL